MIDVYLADAYKNGYGISCAKIPNEKKITYQVQHIMDWFKRNTILPSVCKIP